MNERCEICNRIDALRNLKIHSNTKRCPVIYEVTPVIGCEFQCVYCNALGQEEGNQFLPVQIDKNYVDFLREKIRKNQENSVNPMYYYSPKTDCFQESLLETGITYEILKVFNEFNCDYILVSKGIPSENVFAEMKKSKDRCQVIITYGMPDERLRALLEKGAAPNEKRFEFAKKCIKNDIQTSVILEPILPLEDLRFVDQIMKEFTEIGIKHFALDFARISDICLENITNLIPEHKKHLEGIYCDPNADIKTFRTARGTVVIRRAPSKKYILDKFIEFKNIAKGYGATVSSCNSFNFDEFNIEANAAGYRCMGIKVKKEVQYV